jgi:hypothetical protein
MKVLATGRWAFLVGAEFEVVDNGDSVQAVHGERVVYVSSLSVGSVGGLVPAGQIRAGAASRFGSGERFSHVGESVQGDAELFLDGGIWHLRGTMCADGTVATCMIDLPTTDDLDWAVAVWQSLRCDGKPAAPPGPSAGLELEEPGEDDITRLAEQLMVAERLTARHAGRSKLDGSRQDLAAIQAVLDSAELGPADTYELQCLGVAFGRVVAAAFPGLDWAIINDEYGRDPTLRYTATSVTINVLTMISKRVENGEQVDVAHLLQLVLDDLPRIIDESTGGPV